MYAGLNQTHPAAHAVEVGYHSTVDEHDMTDSTESGSIRTSVSTDWQEVVKQLQQPCNKRALWQTFNTLIPYAAMWVALYLTLGISIWLTIGLAVLTGPFLVRIFILFHDCGHNSFFSSAKANTFLANCLAPLIFVSSQHWRWEHWRHHATSGDLDRRGTGDVWTMTVSEYMASPRWKRLCYRLARNPLLMLTVGPPLLFLVWQRFPAKASPKQARRSVFQLNVTLLVIAVIMSLIFGFWNYVLIQFTMMLVAGMIGVWLFYLQHQFEGVYWKRSTEWDQKLAALQGSSFFDLPAVLRWFTGSIGFHHIHHLGPRIPNYFLKRCHESHPIFQNVPRLTLWTSLKSCSLRLWDEEQEQLVSYRRVRELRRQQTAAQ